MEEQWKKEEGRHKKTEQRTEASDKIRDVKKAYMGAGTTLLTSTSVVPART